MPVEAKLHYNLESVYKIKQFFNVSKSIKNKNPAPPQVWGAFRLMDIKHIRTQNIGAQLGFHLLDISTKTMASCNFHGMLEGALQVWLRQRLRGNRNPRSLQSQYWW